MTSTTIQLPHSKLTYYSTGQGFPLVLLHGFCADHTVWLDMIPDHTFMEPLAEKYRLLMPDLPGFGTSVITSPSDLFSAMDQYADCIKEMLDAEQITHCAMLGHSMGGYIAMNFASRFPGYLKGLGLFHSTAYADDEEKKNSRTKTTIFVKQHGVAPFVKELYSNLFGDRYRTKHQQQVETITSKAIAASSVEGICSACYAMRDRADTSQVLKKITVPVLFIIGQQDKAVAPEKTLPLTHLPAQSTTCLLEHAGHMGMCEEPEQCLNAIRNWMSVIA